MDINIIKAPLIFISFFLLYPLLNAQQFVKVTDSTNPVVSDTPTSGYTGASWIDIDNDGDMDLFVNASLLYENDGSGNFTRLSMSGITGVSSTIGNGNSWGDFDNDGLIDVALANGNSAIFRNKGAGEFEKLTLGVPKINGWSSNWVDYDNDGDLDVFFTHPCCTFIGTPAHSNRMLKNNGDGSFSELSGIEPTIGNAAYTVSNWSDFDNDGDMDLFIGSGEVGFSSKDHLYINQLTESGSPDLQRWSGVPIADELRDGQNWNWIDYDNDGDLDGFVTNYRTQVPNHFYRNDDGTFVKLSAADLGADMVSASSMWLTNFWGDFDNDADLDLVLISDGGGDKYYVNNGDGTFTSKQDAFTLNGSTRGGAAGDMDNDGDLDIFINAPNNNVKGLYKNLGNDNHYLNLTCEGTTSNRSAIGTKVRAKATVNGKAVWQLREITSQSSFCGMNSLRVHFGFGDAEQIDSLLIEWPLGMIETYTKVQADQFCKAIEGQGMDCVLNSATDKQPLHQFLIKINPNPVTQSELQVSYQISEGGLAKLYFFDQSGKLLPQMSQAMELQKNGQLIIDVSGLSNGLYHINLETGISKSSRSFMIAR